MKKRNKNFIPHSSFLIPFLLIIFLIVPAFVFAQDSAPIPIDNPLGKGIFDPREIIGRFIAAVLGIVGSVALLMFIFGGMTWMTAAGNPERVKKGRDMLIWATLGLGVIFTSYVLVQFILSAVSGGVGVTGSTGSAPGSSGSGAGSLGTP